MSLEVFGDEDGGSGVDVDFLYQRKWISDPDCEKFWREGEEDNVYTFEQACKIEEERSWED